MTARFRGRTVRGESGYATVEAARYVRRQVWVTSADGGTLLNRREEREGLAIAVLGHPIQERVHGVLSDLADAEARAERAEAALEAAAVLVETSDDGTPLQCMADAIRELAPLECAAEPEHDPWRARAARMEVALRALTSAVGDRLRDDDCADCGRRMAGPGACTCNREAVALAAATKALTAAGSVAKPEPWQARAERAEAALAEIATLEHCDECPDHDEIPYDPTEHRLAHPVTHETMFFKLQVLLCARCAPLRDARYRKAESKGSGKQPDVVPHEAPEHVRIAREALTAAGRGKGGT